MTSGLPSPLPSFQDQVFSGLLRFHYHNGLTTVTEDVAVRSSTSIAELLPELLQKFLPHLQPIVRNGESHTHSYVALVQGDSEWREGGVCLYIGCRCGLMIEVVWSILINTHSRIVCETQVSVRLKERIALMLGTVRWKDRRIQHVHVCILFSDGVNSQIMYTTRSYTIVL